MCQGAKDYPWLNKPQAIEHWLKHSPPSQSTTVILDPDFIFLKPLNVLRVRGASVTLDDVLPVDAIPPGIAAGRALGQYYRIGTGWLQFASNVCGAEGKCSKVTPQQAAELYQVGPPYMLHTRDLQRIAPLYTEFMNKLVPLRGQDLLTDM